MNPLNSNAGLTAQLARLSKAETTNLADAKRTMITRIPAGAVAPKVVAVSPGVPKLTSDVIAAIDRVAAGSTIEPSATTRVNSSETTSLAKAKRTMITRIPAGAVRLKAVAINPALTQLTHNVMAAIDRAVAGSTIEPVAMSRVYQEERLQAVKEATNLTADEKTASLDRITKLIADLDLKLGSFKGSPAYNAFLAEYANYSKGKEAS